MLSNEDHKDVKGAMGKAIANKVKKATKDYGHKSLFGADAKTNSRSSMYRSKPKRTGGNDYNSVIGK